MTWRGLFVVASLLAGLSVVPAHAEGDPGRGVAVVERWCAICHSVRGTETDPERAPTFEQIPRRPGRGADAKRRPALRRGRGDAAFWAHSVPALRFASAGMTRCSA